jgi:hypothetical protein
MGDQQHGHAGFAAQIIDEIEDLRLHGHIERSGWLVRHQQAWVASQRHGDHHALALTTRKLVRIAEHGGGGRGNADAGQ